MHDARYTMRDADMPGSSRFASPPRRISLGVSLKITGKVHPVLSTLFNADRPIHSCSIVPRSTMRAERAEGIWRFTTTDIAYRAVVR